RDSSPTGPRSRGGRGPARNSALDRGRERRRRPRGRPRLPRHRPAGQRRVPAPDRRRTARESRPGGRRTRGGPPVTPSRLSLSVNRRPRSIEDVPGEERLLDTLRWRLGLKGTKEGCRSGGCGACAVLVDGSCALSCLTLSHEVEGAEITTVE